ncbi:MAG: YihY/virulence factor BrkB family protein [Chloroflexota bacterium]
MNILKTIFELFKEAGQAFAKDKASMLAAALAYYTVFSLAPLLVFSVFVAGTLFGESAVEGQLVEQIQDTVGREAAVVIQNILLNASSGSTGLIATIFSSALLVFGASGVFNQLQQALNFIWGVVPEKAEGVAAVMKLARQRGLTFLMVLIIGILLLSTFILTAVIQAVSPIIVEYVPPAAYVIPIINLAVTPFIMWILFSLIFKVLPQTTVRWRDVWLGSAVTMLLFAAGIYLIGIYLSFNTAGSVYGAASSLIIILLWIYYSAQIFLFGAEFTKVYARRYGNQPEAQVESKLVAAPAGSGVVAESVVGETAVYHPPQPILTYRDEQINTRKQLTAGLIGLTTGLFFAAVGYLRRNA